MKGTVVATWVKTVRRLWGADINDNAMAAAGWEKDRIVSPTEDVPDSEVKKYVDQLVKLLGKKEDDIWLAIGKEGV